jgi:hypothetical protein
MQRRLVLAVVTILLVAVMAPAALARPRTYTAHLTGGAELPVVDSKARGQTVLRLSKDGTELRYRLIVANIDDVTQAHIHVGAEDVNGPVVAFLFGPEAEGVTTSGVLATGTITSADLVGPLGGMPLTALVAALDDGGAYVNVHTLEHPAGEIRGQIR